MVSHASGPCAGSSADLALRPRVSSVAVLSLLVCGSAASVARCEHLVKFPAGTAIPMELLQTVSSAYTDPDSPVYLRVSEDVSVEGKVLVTRGTLVTGRMSGTQGRASMDRSGTFSYDVRFVKAVDGQMIRVLASSTRAGRSRDGAYMTNVVLFGVFGLLTRGASAWVEKGATVQAEAMTDRMVDLDKAVAGTPAEVAAPATSAVHAHVKSHRYSRGGSGPVTINLEKSNELGFVDFDYVIDDPATIPSSGWKLVQVNGEALPAAVAPVAGDGTHARFALWDIARYCGDGSSSLAFTAALADGTSIEASDGIQLEFKRGARH
jgi:hypothetical protein